MPVSQHCLTRHQTVWVLRPNRSITWPQARNVFSIIAIFCLLISSGFALIGAWLILPFAGIELMGLLFAFWYVQKKLMTQEVITIANSSLLLESGKQNRKKHCTQFNPKTVRISVAQNTNPRYVQRLMLEDDKQKVEFANFLNNREKSYMIQKLSQYIPVIGSFNLEDMEMNDIDPG